MEIAVANPSANEMEWAFYGELSLIAFLFDHKTIDNPLILGLNGAKMALKLNPFSQHGYITLGIANLFMNNKEGALAALEQAVRLNPNASGSLGIIGCLMIGLGEYAKGKKMIDRSIHSNHFYPQFFKLFLSLYYFKQKDYQRAYEESDNMVMPDMVLHTILRMAILSKMGKHQELDKITLSIKTCAARKTWIFKEYIQRFLFDKELVTELDKSFKLARFAHLTVA